MEDDYLVRIHKGMQHILKLYGEVSAANKNEQDLETWKKRELKRMLYLNMLNPLKKLYDIAKARGLSREQIATAKSILDRVAMVGSTLDEAVSKADASEKKYYDMIDVLMKKMAQPGYTPTDREYEEVQKFLNFLEMKGKGKPRKCRKCGGYKA